MKTNLLLLAMVTMILSGCATASRGFKSGATQISSDPFGADVFLENQYVGKTPVMVRMSPRHDIPITIQKDGYQPIRLVSTARVDTGGRIAMVANAGGIVFPPALLVTYGVDYLTGAYKAHPPEINAKLSPVERNERVYWREKYQPPSPPQLSREYEFWQRTQEWEEWR